jgi:hypothetical protein
LTGKWEGVRMNGKVPKEKKMRRKYVLLAVMILPLLLLAACSSVPYVEKPGMGPFKPRVIDDQYHGSRQTPDWVFMEPQELQGQDSYKSVYVFRFAHEGGSVEGLREWVRSFASSQEISRMIGESVRVKSAGSAAGDADRIKDYIEVVVQESSQASYSGTTKLAEYWWQVQKLEQGGNLRETYEYFLLLGIPRSQVDSAIERAVATAEAASEPRSADEQAARENVKRAMREGLY